MKTCRSHMLRWMLAYIGNAFAFIRSLACPPVRISNVVVFFVCALCVSELISRAAIIRFYFPFSLCPFLSLALLQSRSRLQCAIRPNNQKALESITVINLKYLSRICVPHQLNSSAFSSFLPPFFANADQPSHTDFRLTLSTFEWCSRWL